MEHKSISGGWEYLPFARARLDAMKAAGLSYGSQKFEVNGVNIAVRLVGGQEYISIDGVSLPINMDSGVVMLGSVIAELPASYLAGKLYETLPVRRYNTPFVLPRPESTVRLNPSTGKAGQLSGTLQTSPELRGQVPIDAQDAQSFIPGKDENGDQKTDDESLRVKKIAALFCPPSIFTGKCRLYVQALYGRHLNDAKGQTKTKQLFPNLSQSSATPSLLLPEYGNQGRTVVLNTSSGIYTDPSTYRHTLINVGPDGIVRAYPLIPSAGGAALRKLLKLGAKNPLNQDDTDRAEAYILSESYPDLDRMQILGPTPVTSYSMGYGWHWNWKGDTADIVVNDQEKLGGPFSAVMRSTHARISLYKVNGQLKCRAEIVEGPTTWAVNRQLWCIAEPEWSEMQLIKTTPKSSSYFACSSPFYVFYKRDAIQVCRVNVNLVGGGSASETYTPGFVPGSWATVGERGGTYEYRDAPTASHQATFIIGDQAISGLKEATGRGGNSASIGGKTAFTLEGFSSSNSEGFFTGPYPVGYPPYEMATFPPHRQNAGALYSVQYDFIAADTRENEFGLAEVVIPFYDSEAVYVSGRTYRDTTKTGTKTRYSSSPTGFISAIYMYFDRPGGGVDTQVIQSFNYANGGPYSLNLGVLTTVVGSTAYNDTQTETINLGSFLVCRAGVLPADFGSTSYFHDNAVEMIPAQFETKVSGGKDPAVVAWSKVAPQNVDTPGVDTSPSVFVGWA